ADGPTPSPRRRLRGRRRPGRRRREFSLPRRTELRQRFAGPRVRRIGGGVRMRRAIVLALALAGCVTPAAPSLAPRPASDLVTLLGGAPATGGCTGAERPID